MFANHTGAALKHALPSLLVAALTLILLSFSISTVLATTPEMGANLLPSAFNKLTPPDGYYGDGAGLSLTWSASLGATSYEYCIDRVNDNACTAPAVWTKVGLTRSVTFVPSINAIYYWQVRAKDAAGVTYANSGRWWSFTIGLPKAFNKISPANTETLDILNPTLTWAVSVGARRYEYCIDLANDNLCTAPASWVSTGLTTRTAPLGLAANRTYYWQVRAVNGRGTTMSAGGWWSFRVGAPPGFNKLTPTNGARLDVTNPTLTWQASRGVRRYEFCIDNVNDNLCTAPAKWLSTGLNTRAPLAGLSSGRTYYWQVRAVNNLGTTMATGAWWNFTIGPPLTFAKVLPVNGSRLDFTTPTLSWGPANGADRYEYCLDTTNDNACTAPAVWVSTGAATRAAPAGLVSGKTYYWNARAVNHLGTTMALGGWWNFSIGPPVAFSKLKPADKSVVDVLSPTLSWAATQSADSYEYCIDTVNDSACTAPATWKNTGRNTSVVVLGVVTNKNYYWHVRAINHMGTTNSNVNAWWSFIISAPVNFNKTSPLNTATVDVLNPILIWAASKGADWYEYCIDTVNDNACSFPSLWVNIGTATRVTPAGLVANRTYYWQVRAKNHIGTTNANLGGWWRFRIGAPPAFSKIAPANNATAWPARLTWGAANGTDYYEFCLDSLPNGICNTSWVSTGLALFGSAGTLTPGRIYEWQVRATNHMGTTYANGGAWWKFLVPPGIP